MLRMLFIAMTVLTLVCIGCSKDESSDTVCDPSKIHCPDKIVDERDGKEYPVVQIGCQCWCQKNLDFREVGECYDNIEQNCDTFGRLYTWTEVMNGELNFTNDSIVTGLCPEFTHLPSLDEWRTLFEYLGGQEIAGGKMKSDDYWDSSGTIDTFEKSGFNSLPAGVFGVGHHLFKNERAYYFTSTRTAVESDEAWFIMLSSSSPYATIADRRTDKGIPESFRDQYSCRCLVDEQ